MDKHWHIYVGEAHIGTLRPTGSQHGWHYATFDPTDRWENFEPWFRECLAAQQRGDPQAEQQWFGQLTAMGLYMQAEDGETISGPLLYIDGSAGWFSG